MSDTTTTTSQADQDRLRALLSARRAQRPQAAARRGDEPLPLGPAQHAMWLASQLQPDSPAYLVPVLLRLSGPLDRPALLTALRRLVERHDVLRGVVDASGPVPVLALRPASAVPLDVVDLGAAADPGAELDRLVHEHVRQPIAPERECPLRVTCFRLDEQEHALLLVLHHMATDAWSNGLLLTDLAALYAHELGQGPQPPRPPQYSEVVAPVPEGLTTRHLHWWQERLRDAPTALDLPADRPARPFPSDAGDGVPLDFPAGLRARLETLAADNGVTLFMVLLACWQALLARVSDSEDIAVGVPDGGRHTARAGQAVGPFVNTVVMRTVLSPAWSGRHLLTEVRDVVLDALARADVPFDRVVHQVRPERASGTGPLFETMANLYVRPDLTGLFPGLTTRFAEIATGAVKSELALHCFLAGADGPLSGVLQYRRERFDPATARRLGESYLRLLTGLVDEPDRPVGELLLTDPAEAVLRGPVRTYPGDPVPELVRRRARSVPGRTAVVAEDGTLTYAELEERAARVADGLLAAGVRAGEPVAVLAERDVLLPVALLGVLRAGAAFVPLEPAHPDDRLARTVTASGARFVLARRALADRVRAAHVLVTEDLSAPGTTPADRPGARVEVAEDQLAYLIFTSGTTGTPKGVGVEHRSLTHYLHAALERIDGHGRSFALLSTAAADLGYLSLFGALVSGGTLHLVERERATDPEGLAEYFATHPVDVVKMVPSHLELLAAHGELAAVLPKHLLVLAGEACPPQLVARVRAARPGLRVHNHYGPTETTVSVLGCEPVDTEAPTDPTTASVATTASVPLGTPFPNALCYVVDRGGRLAPPGTPGELWIAGPGVARGYAGNTGATARSFVPDPVEGTRRCYRTGDRVRVRPDGLVEFLGRLDDQVKVRGYRVEPGEVAAACRALPSVREAVVLAVGEAHRRRLVAWVVPADDSTPFDPAAVRSALRSRLPDHMVPSALVPLPGIPLTPNGKVDRAALPVPQASGKHNGTAPRSAAERRVAAAWREVLELPDRDLDIDDDFFALGGDSFSALRAARLIGPDLRVVSLFTHPTVRELATLLDDPASAGTGLLQRLAGPPPGTAPGVTLVCLPYGGGSAASYQPLAHELAVLRPDIQVLAVELPGHDPARADEELSPLTEVVTRCRDELAGTGTGRVLVYGHCVGTAPAVALALALEEAGEELAGVVLGAAFPSARLPGRLSALVHRWFPDDRRTSDRAYHDVLRALGGQMEEDTRGSVIRAVRHDARQAVDWFSARFEIHAPRRLRAPVLCVVGDRDRTTELFEERYREWTAVADDVSLSRIPHAGHYFLKHQARELAGIIEERLPAPTASVPAPTASTPASEASVPAPTAFTPASTASASASASTVAASASAPPAPVSAPTAPDNSSQRRDLRRFGLFALGQTASMTGSALTSFGLGVWVFQKTHQVSAYSLVTMLAMLPAFLAAPLGGAATDRWDRRKVLLGCAAVYGVTLSGLVAAAATGALQVWQVAVFAALTSLTAAFQRPAYLASVAQLVPKPYLAQANGVVQLGTALSTLIAPVLGGALISLTGLAGVVCIDLVAVLAGGAVLLVIRFPDRLFRRRQEGFLSSITGGWRFLARRPPMVAMVLFFIVVNYIIATTTVLTAPLVLSTSSPAVLGTVTAAGGLGAAVGGLAMAFWGGTRRRADGMIGMTIGMGLATALIGLRPEPVLMGVGLFLWWVCNALLNAHWLAILQAKVGLELQGRVVATNQMLATGLMPLGFLLTPLLLNHLFDPLVGQTPFLQIAGGTGPGRGMGLLMITGGLLLAGWGVLGLRYRPLRHIESRLPDISTAEVVADDLDTLQDEADALLRRSTTRT
ncbi:amino acid adenylation domain-containing protein [Streptomyces sp. NPDC002561]|uniref:non-ribosomal peptide synthetase/MFS transporter n=1 Tax=Streptomyces sp. NPDC002561 TaxID=3154418 RepID=UPI003327D90F